MGHWGVPETGPGRGVTLGEDAEASLGHLVGGPKGSIQELARPQGLEIRRDVEVQRTERRLLRQGRRPREYEGLDVGSTPAGRQESENPNWLPRFQLTLFPVVVSALVSAPRRSNTDVLWRPGREVSPQPAPTEPRAEPGPSRASCIVQTREGRCGPGPGSSGPGRHGLCV